MRYVIITETQNRTDIYGTNKITKQDLKDCEAHGTKIVDSKENKIYSIDVWEDLMDWPD